MRLVTLVVTGINVNRPDERSNSMNIPSATSDEEARFESAMVDIYRRAKNEVGYNATYFLRVVQEHGGLAAAKRLLVGDVAQSGLMKLWELSRLELSMEALVVRPEFRDLFSPEEVEMARTRLREYGYNSDE